MTPQGALGPAFRVHFFRVLDWQIGHERDGILLGMRGRSCRVRQDEMQSCVILLNWNGWKDTIECLESVFRLTYPDFRVIVCDNASNDDSLEKIKSWSRGDLLAESVNPQLSHLNSPPCRKPIPCLELTRKQAESGSQASDTRLCVIQNGENLGFAAGNNVGLRYALGDPRCQFFWLLNNDTVAEPNALSALVRCMEQQPDIGLCGSLNLSYYNPDEVQAEGGRTFSRWTARVHKSPQKTVRQLASNPKRMDYINGASMMVSRAFLETVGLMEESYFLYFEELDWAMRAKGKFDLGYARDSVIYHKEGATIGTDRDRVKRSLISDQYLSRSRVLFTKRFFPWALPSVLAATSFTAIHRLCLGDVHRSKAILSFMLKGLTHVPTTVKSGTRK